MPYAADIKALAQFQKYLIGTWSNKNFGKNEMGKDVGGPGNPLSYNIMPLPQNLTPLGYIIKNFKYFETIKFNGTNDKKDLKYYDKNAIAIAATAPNRGGTITQNPHALFYDQQVSFAEGPNPKIAGTVVHVENGTWLYLDRALQQPGAFPDSTKANPAPDGQQQPLDLTIAKQIAVPHGNSILALGSFDTVIDDPKKPGNPVISGAPVIPDAPLPYPTPIGADTPQLDVVPYQVKTSGIDGYNPHPDLTTHPNLPLQNAIRIIKPSSYIHWHVTTQPLVQGKGAVTNIPFERRVANVTAYWADYWLLSKNGKDFNFLAYTQTMLMDMIVKGHKYVFPHVTCNTVTRQ